MKPIEKAAEALYEQKRQDQIYMFPRAAALWVEWPLLAEEYKVKWRAEVKRLAKVEKERRKRNNPHRIILELTGGEQPVAVSMDAKALNQGYDVLPTLVAWTKNWVVITCTYDSSVWYEAVPRNPSITFEPTCYGGG